MGLESGVTYIEDLVATNPVGATDNVDEGDDHLRNIKTAVKGSFPNLGNASVTRTAAQINDSATKTGTETLTNKTITSPKINALWDSTTSKLVLSITADPAAVNNIIVKAQPTGVAPLIRSSGEADLGLIIYDSNSNELLKLASVSGATNEITITNSTGGVSIEATGSDTNIDIDITPKGSGTVNLPADSIDSDALATASSTGNHAVTAGTPYLLPAGWYMIKNTISTPTASIELNVSTGWVLMAHGGLVFSDGTNTRLVSGSGVYTFYWRKLD
jgi:hypothetical protein